MNAPLFGTRARLPSSLRDIGSHGTSPSATHRPPVNATTIDSPVPSRDRVLAQPGLFTSEHNNDTHAGVSGLAPDGFVATFPTDARG